MSPENVERGRRLVSREDSWGIGRRPVAIFFVPICLKRRRSACGSRKPVNLLFPHLLVGAAALRTSFKPEAHMSRPPFRHGRT